MRKFDGDTLVLATHNKGKITEFQKLLGGRVPKLLSASDVHLDEPEETGTTFLENATLKAVTAARSAGLPCMADDSGLCVNALDGDPGIYSARWVKNAGGEVAAMKEVHDKIGAENDRGAAFVAVLVLAWPDGVIAHAEGRVDGTITWPMRGTDGHGYDPIFIPNGEARTFAEMSMDEKNNYSHRARALTTLIDIAF